ncbi:hypothetical protein DH2020_006075 [Rehmannia glutinosa]|uniref:Uncharacterized protein n=1 Tax=Rehmannia glutinosa TaxID=99300 RepID=A0ABR0XIH2_REHGL
MVPSREYSGIKQSCFPQCLDWITDNQNPGQVMGFEHPYLVKDSLSCTLACVLALQKWSIGHQLVQRGLEFIASNGWVATHNDQFSPVGFNVIFPAMVNYAKELDLTLPLSHTLVDSLLRIRDSEIRKQNQEYAAEGLVNSCDWKRVILTHQRSNGSLFNSPATTAAALIHSHDDKCFDYLNSVLKACNRWVPTVYPMDIYTRLCVVDTLERLGVNRYFEFELSIILDEIYRYWQEKDEEIFSDSNCQIMAFRLLRVKGYDVSSEPMLEKLHAWTSGFLKQQLLNQNIFDKRIQKQVEYDLKNFHGTLDRVGHRRSIVLYDDAQDFQILKTTYRCPTIHNEDFILLSVQNFRISQAQYQDELQQLERWYTDRLNHGREACRISYMITTAAFFGPELSVARISYAQVCVLITCLDDIFDNYGSREEVFCIIELVSKWNMQPETTYCSQEVEIIFTALYNTVNEVAAKVYANQAYCVKHDLAKMWLELQTSFARQKDSWSADNVSTLDEYLSFAWKSISCKICVFTATHFLGMQLSEEIFTCEEYNSLCKHAALVCYLKTFKREHGERVLNSVNVQIIGGDISEEEAILKVQQIVEYHRTKVLEMVYQRKGSIVPRECKELFGNHARLLIASIPTRAGTSSRLRGIC